MKSNFNVRYDEEIKYVRNMLTKHHKQYAAWCLVPPGCARSGYVSKFFLWKNSSNRFRGVNCDRL